MKVSGKIVHHARAVRSRAWRIGWGLMFLFSVPPAFLVDPPEALWQRFAIIPIYALTWGIPFWIWLLTLWSINRYGDITVTDQVLRVGRETVPLDQLDATWVRALLSAEGTMPGLPGPTRVRRIGGSFGSTIGSRTIVLRLRTGDGISFDLADRPAFLTALLSVLRTG